MNGFRITVLTLLCLSVGLMFYAVFFVVPSWQSNYNAYQSSLRISEFEKKNDIHRRQMEVFDPSFEAPEVEKARLDVEESARRDELAVNEAEENNVIAASKRREEEARARAEAERAAAEKDESVSSAVIGIVASYDKEWQCIMIKPAVPEAFVPGAVLAVRRDRRILCEAVVDSRDAESGQVSATLKIPQGLPNAQGEQEGLPAELQPVEGDDVIPTPFPTSDELRAEAGMQPRVVSPFVPSEQENADRIPPLPAEVPALEGDFETDDTAPEPQLIPATVPSPEVQRALDAAVPSRPLPSLDEQP